MSYQEPSSMEYGKAIQQAHNNLNKWAGWSVIITNCGFLGYNVKAPTGEWIQIFSGGSFWDKGGKYETISGTAKINGNKISNNTKFASIEEVMEYLISTFEKSQSLQKTIVAPDIYPITFSETNIINSQNKENQIKSLYAFGKTDIEVAKELLKEYTKNEVTACLMNHAPDRPTRTDEARTFIESIIRKAQAELKKESQSTSQSR